MIMKEEKIISGNFIVDMRSINCQDLSGKSKNYLESHLKSEDFFWVDNFVIFFDKDGEEIMKGEGNLAANNLKYTFGDFAAAGSQGTFFRLDDANNRFILRNDSNNAKVGINTNTPGQELEVVGDISASGAIDAMSASFHELQSTNTGSGIILTSPNGTRYRVTVGNDGSISLTGSLV